jgi:hypothetical protein
MFKSAFWNELGRGAEKKACGGSTLPEKRAEFKRAAKTNLLPLSAAAL